METITCIIVDDEPKARLIFDEVIGRYFKGRVKILASVDSVKAGVAAIQEHRPQIVFLDIEMPFETGFRLFDYFTSIDFEVIFLTAHKEHGINAIKCAALDYLLKPVNYIDLMSAFARYEKHQGAHASQLRIETLLSNLGQGLGITQKIALPTRDGYSMEYINDIVYCEADVNYTRIHTITNKTHLVTKTLKAVEDLLAGETFVRIHKSYLINMNYLKSYSKSDGFQIVLETGQKLPVAQRKNDEFMRTLAIKSKVIER
jgi:two-component system LytT family response regulator